MRHCDTLTHTVTERSLAFYRLHFIVSGNQSLVSDTIAELVSVLKVWICTVCIILLLICCVEVLQ